MIPIDSDAWLMLVYAAALGLLWISYGVFRRRRNARGRAVLETSRRDGLMEPASLHPLIDDDQCIGCVSCIDACPEHDVLGLVHGKAALVTPANCIGHGACREACPVGAITLVLGTERRGVDIPLLDADFQTNVPGIFVAGELGGMGLIRNAVEQGRQAIDAIRRRGGGRDADVLDVLIVGAGPAGLSASLAALEAGLRFVTLEQETLGGTVAHYPRCKIVMTAPVDLPLHGRVRLRETTKEALLDLWTRIARETGLEVRTRERVDAVERRDGVFEVRSTRGRYRTRNVLLAIGRRGSPRKLGVPGEEHPKVVYRLIEPEQYQGRRALVVGGGDSALEAALALAEQRDATVALSYRGEAFSRAKPRNRARVEEAAAAGALRLLLGSQLQEILPESVRLRADEELLEIDNEAVIVCAGGVLPTGFLRTMGVEIETKYGTA